MFPQKQKRMSPFLKQVAQYLYNHNEISLQQTTIIVPNRRSGVFFTAYLNECVSHAMIAPEVLTISELVGSLSENQEADKIAQLFLLHEIYQQTTGHIETLDEFYFWGEILLHDFNDIDKYLIDADDLFRNIKDLKEIESHFDYLNERQRKAIKEFWGIDLEANGSTNRTQFLNIWSKLATVYHRFKQKLRTQKACYNGMFYRDLVEAWNDDTEAKLHSENYIFVGFNALNKAEIALFKHFNKCRNCLFFWDYDEEFLHDEVHEAGLFMRKNLSLFPQPKDFQLEHGDKSEQQISIISVPSQIAQTQIINHPDFKPQTHKRFDDNAIILAEESLLVPTVSAAGALQEEINITMGYPISNTPVYNFINLLIELQRNLRKHQGKPAFYYRPVISILNHQLLTTPIYKELVNSIIRDNRIYIEPDFFQHDELLRLIFQPQSDWHSFCQQLLQIINRLAVKYQHLDSSSEHIALEAEYLYQAYLGIQQLHDALQSHLQELVSMSLFFRILQQAIGGISIPFEGEPLSGMQVMGVLETRNLDFERVFMLSVNHGRLPSTENTHSFIPYNLRKAFELPTYEEHDAMYAYYFYRMLNRAKEIVLVYDSSSNGLTTGEMSRYLYQLIYDSKRHIRQLEIDFNYKSVEHQTIAIPSTPERRAKLLKRYQERKLSPSELNTYLDCKFKFYLSYVAGIKAGDEIEEEVDNRIFGNLFHDASEIIYRSFEDKTIDREMLDAMAKNEKQLNKAINQAFAKAFKLTKEDEEPAPVELNGNNLLVANQLLTYLRQMLRNDKLFAPLQMVDLEKELITDFELEIDGKMESFHIGGTVDRIDRSKDGLRIIDYKTGKSAELNFTEISDFTDSQKKKKPKEIFQTLLYCEIYSRLYDESNISPNIYKIDTFFKDFAPQITMGKTTVNYAEIRNDFNTVLHEVLRDLFHPDNVFTQKEEQNCNFCPYIGICGRKESQY